MGKGTKRERKAPRSATKTHLSVRDDKVDDEIDAFHRQRDVVPLDINNKFDESDDEDLVQPVFEFEGDEEDDSGSDRNDDDGEESDGTNDDLKDKGLAAKIARQARYLRQKFGADDDEMDDYDEEEEEEKQAIWGRKKNLYYSADNVDYELQSSDEDLPMEEEAEVVKLQREKATNLSMEDFGLENIDQDHSDSNGQNKLFQDVFVGKMVAATSGADKENQNYEKIEKDLTALSKEEQMDFVYRSAPELVGLLSELNDALDQVQKMEPACKSKEKTDDGKGRKRGMQFLEVKQALLLTYCQAISYYLLLKSEGHPVRDHPVIARLVEIKSLLEKVNQIDVNLPSERDKAVNNATITGSENVLVRESALFEVETDRTVHSSKPNEDLEKNDSSVDAHKTVVTEKKKDVQMGLHSLEMLKVRADLEAKLRQKGIYNLTKLKPGKVQNGAQTEVNGRVGMSADFDDAIQPTALGDQKNVDQKNVSSSFQLRKLSEIVGNRTSKSKMVSGDDDLPKRDDIGERRRRHELQVLARVGAIDDTDLVQYEDGGLGRSPDLNAEAVASESEDELYRDVKRQRVEKLMAKAEKYTRKQAVPSSVEVEADGKRHITSQMEKNRGLTRPRKKLTKNPRKKYRHKHEKQIIRRKGQVREIRKPSGPYAGEATGINPNISRSIRFKS